MPGALVLLAAVLLPPWSATPSPVLRPAIMAQSQAPGEPSANASLALDWTAPAGCPDGNAVRADAIRLAGATAPGARHLKARASIAPATGTGWVLSLTTDLEGVSGERTLSGVSCESLAEAAALMLALILNPDLALTTTSAASAQQPPPPAATVTAANDRRPRPRWRVGAYGGVQTGVIENLSSSFGLSLGVALGHLSLRLMPGLTPPQDIISDPQLNLGGRLWLVTAAALGCWEAAVSRLALSPCLGVDVTRLQGHGLGVATRLEATAYWSAAELALFVGLPVGYGVQLELGGLGMLPLHRPTVYLEGIGPVSRPAVFDFRALGGLAWIF